MVVPVGNTEALTLTSGEVAKLLGYLTRDGDPNRRLIRKFAGEGKIPPPINDEVALAHWRWSRAEIEAYVAGEWRAVS
jgi:hypothetical protein